FLCAATPQFEELGAERHYETPELHYPGAITRLRGFGFTQLRDALSGKKFQIVHLLGFFEPRSGEFVFGNGDRLPGNALLRLLEPFQAELIVLASCDSLTLVRYSLVL